MINHLRAYSGNEDFYFVGTHEMLSEFLDKQNLYSNEEEYVAMGYDFLTDGSLVGLLPINLVIDNLEIAKVFRELYLNTDTKVWKVEKVKDKARVCEKCGSHMKRIFMGLCECTNENCGNKYDMEDEID